ncbi:MAG: PilZ domain-containing protein [Myxococcales bacterium]|nr:PilZ domain-containing protein [Myxococcales bacterium]
MRDSVSLRLRSVGRVLGAEVLGTGEHPLLRIHSGVVGLRQEHFEDGLDIDLYVDNNTHMTTTDIPVVEFRPNRLEVLVCGPIELRAVVRRSCRRDHVGLAIRIMSYCGKQSFAGCTFDLGGGGLSFTTSEKLNFAAGENVRIELMVLEKRVLASARVAWVANKDGIRHVGLAFVEVDRAGHDHLYQFIYGLQRQKQAH